MHSERRTGNIGNQSDHRRQTPAFGVWRISAKPQCRRSRQVSQVTPRQVKVGQRADGQFRSAPERQGALAFVLSSNTIAGI
jgi:hypothetical protein